MRTGAAHVMEIRNAAGGEEQHQRDSVIMEYKEVMTRHIGVLTEEDQEKIRHTAIAIAGVGGTGSAVAILAAKAGFGRIVVVDKDSYEFVNVVEQLLATTETVGCLKVKVAEEVLPKHGPFTRVESVVLDINTVEDARGFLQGVDYLIMAIDEPVARVVLDRAAREVGIPLLGAANVGWKIFNSTHLPDGMSFEEFTHQYSFGKELDTEVKRALEWHQRIFIACVDAFDPDYAERYLRGEVSYISYTGPAAVFASSAVVSNLLKLVTGRGEVPVAPKSFCFDLLTNEPWDMSEVGRRIGQVAPVLFTRGLEEGIRRWKQVMGYD